MDTQLPPDRLDDERWQRILAYGAERAKASGYTDDDIPRLIAELRHERHQEQ